MKTKSIILLIGLLAMVASTATAQFNRNLQYFRYNDARGLNVYEVSKTDTVGYDGLQVRVGGDFAIQFQGLSQDNLAGNLADMGGNFNLPTANLNLDVQLYDGVRMHLRTYLSSRHHEEAWVKGGYLQIDKLDFIKPGFAENFMKIARITVGLDELNYGDWHFRRSDNARAIYNPFVGNLIMDSFTTEAFGEVTLLPGNFIVVLGLSNGKLNQNVIVNDNTDNKMSFYGKLGYQMPIGDEDNFFRITGSWYTNNGTSTGTYLFGGDRAGGRYYGVLWAVDGEGNASGSDFEPRFNPRFRQMTAIQLAPSFKLGGLEFFGLYEIINNGEDQGNGNFNQVAAEALYRFGGRDQLYIGGRYNAISGERNEGDPEIKINRINIGGGWYLTKNILAKIEYVNQEYKGDGWQSSKYDGASFDGIVIEAAISF
ncbi:hypothetical protein [Fulvivirga sedimenti]|uniref:Porin n=1 Tax=Fulvivirga sedimenti TaxID=2879465 RepID=A0A9X1HMM6_9BACT|nr:hypothetical protein [Fulvivirga sedimenti]MCA6073795.1 hypothetical protein [Fulvivirga sedimenti]